MKEIVIQYVGYDVYQVILNCLYNKYFFIIVIVIIISRKKLQVQPGILVYNVGGILPSNNSGVHAVRAMIAMKVS